MTTEKNTKKTVTDEGYKMIDEKTAIIANLVNKKNTGR